MTTPRGPARRSVGRRFAAKALELVGLKRPVLQLLRLPATIRRATLHEHVAVCSVRGEVIKLHVTSAVEQFRAKTFETKEPETLDWIDEHVRPGDVFYDVGANIGLFSLYAAKRGARVYAFEPEALNYAQLNRNIVLNGLGERVTAYATAIADSDHLDELYVRSFERGAALHNVGSATDGEGGSFIPAHRQGVLCTTLDSAHLKLGLPAPRHIKIDVDGFEKKVLAGAVAVFGGGSVRSALIEIATSENDQYLQVFAQLGVRIARRVNIAAGMDNVILVATRPDAGGPPR